MKQKIDPFIAGYVVVEFIAIVVWVAFMISRRG
jgi:hypothetical protein